MRARLSLQLLPLFALLLLTAVGLPARQAPSLRVVMPQDGLFVGRVLVEALVEPAGTTVERVDFFLDGVSICTVRARPFTCEVPFGNSPRDTRLQVTAFIPNREPLRVVVAGRVPAFLEASRAHAVAVWTRVTDSRGRPVLGLPRDAFRILDDDVVQPDGGCVPARDAAIHVLVAIDTSQSAAPTLPDVKNALRRFLAELEPEDEATLLGFNSDVYVLARQEKDPDVRAKAVDGLTARGPTALLDAIHKSFEYLPQNPGAVRALVVFTDGDDLYSRATPEAILGRLNSHDANVYFVLSNAGKVTSQTRNALSNIATKSGGRVLPLNRPVELTRVLSEVVRDLKAMYACGFQPTGDADGRIHTIQVTVPGRNDLRVSSRRFYVVK